MRILLLGSLFPDSFTRNIHVTLAQMGHEVASLSPGRPPSWAPYYLRISWAEAAQRGWLDSPHRTIRRKLRAFDAELVLNGYWDLAPLQVAEIRSAAQAPVVAWFPDPSVSFRRQYLLGAAYDAVFLKARYMVEFARQKLNKPAFYLPECCNPQWHRRVELTESEGKFYGCDLTTAATLYYYRARLLELFVDYDLKIWGAGIPPWLDSPLRHHHQKRYVAELEKAKAFNAAKIVLNTMHPAEIESVNARLFETAGCGAFQIMEHRDCLSEYFEPETEVVTFHTRKEFKEKVDYYLAREEERQQIADRAYARAQREHTYEHRLRQLLKIVSELQPETNTPRT